jgi:CBS domain-containing protein
MIKDTNTIDVDSTVVDAAKVMAADDRYEGYVIVLRKGKPIGIVTERDIINRALAHELDPTQTTIAEIVSIPLRTIDPDDDLMKAATSMREYNVRKLVVMRDEIVYGIITAKEIAQRCGEYVDRSVKDIIRWSSPLSI